MPPIPPTPPKAQRKPPELLPFKPWMLALAVFLGCALGVAIMEDLRSSRGQWAHNSYGFRP